MPQRPRVLTGTVFNRLQCPSDVVYLVVLWRVRYRLSLRDLAEMFLERGFVFTHEAVREGGAEIAMGDWRTRANGAPGLAEPIVIFSLTVSRFLCIVTPCCSFRPNL